MAFEVIKGFFAVKAAVYGFAGGGAKLAHQFGVVRVAAGALHGFLLEHLGGAKLLLRIGWRDAERFEFLLAFFGHPVRGPGRGKGLVDDHISIAFFNQLQSYVHADDIHGRATGIGRRNGDGNGRPS